MVRVLYADDIPLSDSAHAASRVISRLRGTKVLQGERDLRGHQPWYSGASRGSVGRSL